MSRHEYGRAAAAPASPSERGLNVSSSCPSGSPHLPLPVRRPVRGGSVRPDSQRGDRPDTAFPRRPRGRKSTDPVFARRVSSAIFLGKVANASRPRGCVRSAAGPAPCWGAHAGTVGAGTKEKVVVSGSQARNSRGSSRQNWVDRIFDIASTVSRRTALWGPEDGRHQAPVKAADLFAHSHFAKTIFRTRIALPRNPQARRVERKRASAPFQGLPTLILHA